MYFIFIFVFFHIFFWHLSYVLSSISINIILAHKQKAHKIVKKSLTNFRLIVDFSKRKKKKCVSILPSTFKTLKIFSQ